MRVAIVGSGGIARIHARLVRELGGEVAAVCGRTLDGARSLGVGTPFDDLTAMLTTIRPDVVHVCTPNHLHAEQTIAALATGAHVLCEKPLATNSGDGRRMVEAATAAGRVGAVAYCYRGYPLLRALRRDVAAGRFGRLRRIGGVYLSQDVFAADKYQWHFSPGTVGSSYALMDYGVHWLDLAEFVTGRRIVAVTAQLSTHQGRRVWRGGAGQGPRPPGEEQVDGGAAVHFKLEDQADLLLRFEGGAAGALTVSAVSPGHPNHIALSVDGDLAGFDWQQERPNTCLERRPGAITVRQRDPDAMDPADRWSAGTPAGHPEGYLDAFRNVIAESWQAMGGEAVSYPSFADGLRGVELVERALASAAWERQT
ncbi:MAG: Gfo/Idh/MocA family protein [Geminicoccaceae bacterium]